MTHQQMHDTAAAIVANLEPEQTTEFANILREAIQASYNAADLQIIDAQLLAAGVDATPICRKRIPA